MLAAVNEMLELASHTPEDPLLWMRPTLRVASGVALCLFQALVLATIENSDSHRYLAHSSFH